MKDTPLGLIIAIRSETDPYVLKHFTPEQRQIRREWSDFKLSKSPEKLEKQQTADIKHLENMIAAMFRG